MSVALQSQPEKHTYVKIVTITPAMAAKWLTQNTNNRASRPAQVDRYARDMVAGNWYVTGDSIKFGTDGTLLDGQHRLMAIVAAAVAVTCPVAYDVAAEARPVLDSGIRRTAGDALTIGGMAYGAQMAAAAGWLLSYDDGYLPAGGRVWSHAEITQYVDRSPHLYECCARSKALAKALAMTPTACLVAYYLTARDGYAKWTTTDVERFINEAVSGADLPKGSPVLALVHYGRGRYNLSQKSTSGQARATVQAAVLVKALNAYRQHASVKVLRWTRDTFPVVWRAR